MSFGFGFALPAYPLRGGGGNNPFNQLGPTLDLSFAGVVTDQSDPNGYTLNTNFIIPQYQIAAQYVVWETGVGLVDKTFSQIITFTRASTATYFDATGTLQSAAIDAPRLDYNPSTLAAQGLLIEEARTNLMLYSEQFDNAWWTKTRSSITANATTAPTGTAVADKLVEDTSASASHPLVSTTVTLSGTTVHSFSVFAKAAERTAVVLRINAGADSVWGSFNLLTGAVGTAANAGTGSGATLSIQNVGNGWYRCTLTGICSSTSTTPVGVIYPAVSTADPANTSIVYTGDGTSGIFLWGAQLEAGAFPTSYIPTTTTALTRSADVGSVNTLAPWYNSTEGTVYAEVMLAGLSATANQNAMQFSDGTSSNRIAIYRQSAALGTALSFGTTINGGAWTTTSTRKLALGNQSGNSALVENGAITGTGAGTTAQTVNQLRLGSNHDGTGGFANGYLRRIVYYPRRLSNAELQSITS